MAAATAEQLMATLREPYSGLAQRFVGKRAVVTGGRNNSFCKSFEGGTTNPPIDSLPVQLWSSAKSVEAPYLRVWYAPGCRTVKISCSDHVRWFHL